MKRIKYLGLFAGIAFCASALADDDHSRRQAQVINNPLYKQECAACHTAYPPGMLPAASWQRIMGGLDKHYGRDASLEPETVATLTQYLTQHAGTYRRVRNAPPEDRITKSDWFIRKHDEIPPSAWRHVKIKSAANCAACHTTADRGDYDEDNVRMPPGVRYDDHR